MERCAGGGEGIWLALHSDWDLDAAFIACSSAPQLVAAHAHDASISSSASAESDPVHCLRLRVYPRAPEPHDGTILIPNNIYTIHILEQSSSFIDYLTVVLLLFCKSVVFGEKSYI